MRCKPFLVALVSALLTAAPLSAWETRLTKPEPEGEKYPKNQWLSIYEFSGARPIEGQEDGFHKNEHAEFADITLRRLQEDSPFSMQAGLNEALTIIDLNASLFRRKMLEDLGRGPGQSLGLGLETRRLPAPPHFAGIPDFSYSIYDWINKNVTSLCPGVPIGAPLRELCHRFDGWLGASLNASHFGTQATNMYARLHNVAMMLGGRARRFRETLEAADNRYLDTYKDYLREAELMALSYEGYAQHFFQDRWSTGHMWEPWNAGGYEQIAYPQSLGGNFEVGATAGMIHGAESVFGDLPIPKKAKPDPMSSPVVEDNTVKPVMWRHGRKGRKGPPCKGRSSPCNSGVGDHRLKDIFDEEFGEEYGYEDLSLNVTAQRQEMLNCLSHGWADVIREFGAARGSDRTFGVHGATVAGKFPKTAVTKRADCFDMWATNSAIDTGWNTGLSLVGGSLSRIVKIHDWAPLTLADMIRMSSAVTRVAGRDPDETNLARRKLGDLGEAKPGGQYRGKDDRPFVPAYVVPEAWEGKTPGLPTRDTERGRDKLAIYGFFNRAHADYWCHAGGIDANEKDHDILELLESLRTKGKDSKRRRRICLYLADRLFQGTDPVYEGRQSERRTFSGRKPEKDDDESKPICWFFKEKKEVAALYGFDDYTEEAPVNLHPGYVGFLRNEAPYDKYEKTPYQRSLMNWCNKVAVLDLAKEPELRDADVVAEIEDITGSGVGDASVDVELTGRNFGQKTGRIYLVSGAAPVVEIRSPSSGAWQEVGVEAWSDRRIAIRIQKTHLDPAVRDYYLRVDPTGGSDDSVGRFLLRIKKAPARIGRASGTYTFAPVGDQSIKFREVRRHAGGFGFGVDDAGRVKGAGEIVYNLAAEVVSIAPKYHKLDYHLEGGWQLRTFEFGGTVTAGDKGDTVELDEPTGYRTAAGDTARTLPGLKLLYTISGHALEADYPLDAWSPFLMESSVTIAEDGSAHSDVEGSTDGAADVRFDWSLDAASPAGGGGTAAPTGDRRHWFGESYGRRAIVSNQDGTELRQFLSHEATFRFVETTDGEIDGTGTIRYGFDAYMPAHPPGIWIYKLQAGFEDGASIESPFSFSGRRLPDGALVFDGFRLEGGARSASAVIAYVAGAMGLMPGVMPTADRLETTVELWSPFPANPLVPEEPVPGYVRVLHDRTEEGDGVSDHRLLVARTGDPRNTVVADNR